MKMTGKIVDKRKRVTPSIIRSLAIFILFYMILLLFLTFITNGQILKA